MEETVSNINENKSAGLPLASDDPYHGMPENYIVEETADGEYEPRYDPEGYKAMHEDKEAQFNALMGTAADKPEIAGDREDTAQSSKPAGEVDIESDLGDASFKLKPDGVYWIKGPKDKPEEYKISRSLRFVAAARDDRNENWCRVLEFEDPDDTTHRYILRSEDLAGDGKEILAVLYRLGFGITPDRAAKTMVLNYIADTVPLQEKRYRITERTGWHGSQFIFPDKTIGHNDEDYIFESASSLIQTYSQQGTLDTWREQVASLCRGNSRLTFAVSAAFASPLLAITNDENGGFHFYGSSSTGKTHTLYVAASVCGRPTLKDKNSYIHSWRGTSNGLEGIAKLHSDSPLILDELGEVSPKDAGETAYMLGNGVGKQRANQQGEARHRSNWRCLFLSTGEITLSQHMLEGGKRARAGQEIRLIDIPADPGAGYGVYENIHGQVNGRVFSELLKSRTLNNYGTAFPTFIQAIISDRCALPEKLKAYRDRFIAENLPEGSTSQIHRVASRMALVAAAGEYATEVGITGWSGGDAWEAARCCFQAWLAHRDAGTGMQEDAAIINQVRRFFAQHGSGRFVEQVCDKKLQEEILMRPIQNRAGFRVLNADEKYEYAVLKEVFNEEICKGFNPRSVAKLLLEKGILHGSGGKENRPSRVLSLPGMGQVRCYHFLPSVLEDTEE